MAVQKKPEGYHSVTPYLLVDGADRLMEFMKQAFGATERGRMGDERVMHAEMQIGDSIIMLSDTMEGYEPTQVMLHLYVDDADAVYKRAVAAGGTPLQEPQDQFYGDRSGAVSDAFGNRWWIATHVEDVPEEEMQRRMTAQPTA